MTVIKKVGISIFSLLIIFIFALNHRQGIKAEDSANNEESQKMVTFSGGGC